MINVKLCMMVLLTELYLCMQLSVTMTILQGQCQTVSNVLVQLSWNFVQLLVMSSRSWIYHYFDCCIYLLDIIKHCNFLGHYKCDKCQTLHDGTTHWAFPVHTIFIDLDHISRSQQCQIGLNKKYKKIVRLSCIRLLNTSDR